MQVSQTNPLQPNTHQPTNKLTNQPLRKAPSSHPELRQGGVQVYMHRWDWSLSQAKLVESCETFVQSEAELSLVVTVG